MGRLQYFASREDGETFGPFEDSDSALVWIVDDFADPDGVENGVLERYQIAADQLYDWYQSLASRSVTHSSHEYGFWLRAAKDFAKEVEFLVFGIEFVVDPNEGNDERTIKGIMHLIEPHQVHLPEDSGPAGLRRAQAQV